MKIPLFSITPLIESYYIEQIGNEKISFKESRSIKKSEKKLNKSINDPVKWIYIEFEGQKSLVLMKKSLDNHVFLTGSLRLKKAKTEKDLEYWKKKLLDVLRLQKSLDDILYPEGVPGEAQGLLLKAKGFAPGTVREWKGQKFKKLSSGKWMRLYEGSGSRGEKQATRNVIKKIQNASSMEEMLEIVRLNKERFVDSSGKALPVIAEFLKVARKGEEKPVKPKEDKAAKTKLRQESLDIMAQWLKGGFVVDIRNSIRLNDGTLKKEDITEYSMDNIKNQIKKYVDFADNHLETIKDKFLYRGTQNKNWLNVKPGDEIPLGMASFSKSEEVAKGFTGDSNILIRYSPPPNAEGIDFHKLMGDKADNYELKLREVPSSIFNEKEVALRSKALRVKKITINQKENKASDREYTIIDVEVVPVKMSKSIDNSKLIEELSNDFNNPLSKRDKKEEKTEKTEDDKTLAYWKKKITHFLEGDLIEKSLKEILFPGILIKSLSMDVLNMLIKARGFPVGTIRNWRGKEHKKMANGKWVRTYKELESRGAKQAIGNVRRKIISASTMEELLEIVKQNASRFQNEKGKMLPIVKEFITAVRSTEIGRKPIEEPIIEEVVIERKQMATNKTFEIDTEEADKIVDRLTPENEVMGYYYQEDEGDVTFYAEVKEENYINNIAINPYDILEKPKEKPVDIQKSLTEKIISKDFEAYGSWDPEGKHLKPAQREKLNQEIAELINKDFHTQEEKDIIRLYSGFGGTKVADERGLLYDYYTSPPVAKMIFQAINKINPIKKNDKVLEPSCGTGVFFDVAPEGVKTIGVEYDPRTAKAADILQPESDITTGSFEQFNLYSEKNFDIVIGNSPFGKRSVETSFIDSDTDANGKTMPGEDTLDRYFISKSLDNLKPGGTLGMVAYSGIMNNVTNTEWRKEMLRKGQFVGAMQLPNESFKHTQTGVSPDIYYFKKHSKEVADKLKTATEEQLKESGAWNKEWVNGGYYDKHPKNRLGKQGIGQFGADITVGKMTDELLNNAVKNFVPEIKEIDVSALPSPVIEKLKDNVNVTPEEAAAVQAKTLLIGSTKTVNGIVYFLNGNHRWERVKGQEDLTEKIPSLTNISLKVNEIRRAMQSDVNPTNLQNEVRELLDKYKEDYGSYPNSDSTAAKLIKINPSLKSIHEAINVTMESGILNNQNIYAKEVRIVDGHQPDIVALKEIQQNLAVASPEIVRNMYPDDAEKLMDIMINNPDVFIDSLGNYQLREDFIAGDAWTKIDDLRNMMDESENPNKIQYGIDELEKAIGWVSIEDADVMPQSSWIPLDIIQKWSEEEYDQTVYRRDDGTWDSSGSYSKNLTYFMNFQKQRGGSKEENEIDTMVFNQSAEESFKNFISTHEDLRLQMEELYNRKFNTELGVPNKTYTVNIEGWDKYTLDPWQWQSIHHLYEKGKGMSAMGTGFGKTLAAVGLLALLRQEGKVKRPLIQVPNNKVKDWLRIINAAMPGLKVGAVDPEEKGYGNRDVRYQMYQDLANSDYDVLILPETSASEIQLSEEEDAAITSDVIMSQMPDLKTEKQKEKAKESLRGRMISGKKNQTITFEDLGVDALFVDEAHNYKNLFSSSLSRETGLNDGRRSERALSFYKKTEYIRKKNDGKNVFLLTATPLTNSPLEYYNMLSHIAPEEFAKLGISNINDFIKNFADIQQSDEVDWASDRIVNKKVLKGFKNLRSLQDMFFKYTDFQNDPNKIGIEKPKPTKRANILAQDDAQVSELKDLSAQLEAYKKKSKEDRDDSENTLTFFSKMRTASLDLELYNPKTYKGWENPKLTQLADNAYDNFKATDGGQVIFCDRVLSSDKTFNMHDKIKQQLVAKGFKPDEIVIVNGITKSGSAQSDKALQTKVSDVIDGFNSGKYKVVIGTTGTIGEGVNLQKNSAALHHVDIPYRPSDFIQRNGRIDRQGNKQKTVELHTYASSGTTDNFSIAKVSGKENWINTLLKTKSSVFTNPDGEGFDMDEMMISLQGEWGIDTAVLKEKIKERKEVKVKQRNITAMNDTMKKLSTVRGAIESYTKEKGSAQYKNMINKESVYTKALNGNPEFHNHELTNGERTPFMYDSRNKKVMKIGDYYSKGKNLYKVRAIDFKKGEVKFYNIDSPDYEGYDLPSWSIKRGFGTYGYQDPPRPLPSTFTAKDADNFKKAVGGEFFILPDQAKKEHYGDYIIAGDGKTTYSRQIDAFYLADNKVTVFSNNNGVLLNPYVKEDLAKIKKHVTNFNKNYDFEDTSTENSNARYHIKQATKDPAIPQELRDSFNSQEITQFKKDHPEFIEKLKDSPEWKPIPADAKLTHRNMLETLGYETDYKKIEGTRDYGYHYRRIA